MTCTNILTIQRLVLLFDKQELTPGLNLKNILRREWRSLGLRDSYQDYMITAHHSQQNLHCCFCECPRLLALFKATDVKPYNKPNDIIQAYSEIEKRDCLHVKEDVDTTFSPCFD